MRLGYNTNGLAHHRIVDALELLAAEGFESVALTLDAGVLDPFADRPIFSQQLHEVATTLDRLGLGRVVETGARYLLNPRKKHDPTLLDADPARRAIRSDFLLRSIDIAADLRAEAVSFWSGAAPEGMTEAEGLERLAAELGPIVRHADEKAVRLAFEPEPGMFIDTFAMFAKLDERVAHARFDLTVDLGHVHCIEDEPIADLVRAWGPRIANIHVEDMVRGVHDHLMFGEGTMDFPPIFEALREVGYRGGLHVELSRHSHMAPEAVRRSAAFLRPLLARP